MNALDKARTGLQWAYAVAFVLFGFVWLVIGAIGWSAGGWWVVLVGLAFWLISFLMIKSLRKK